MKKLFLAIAAVMLLAGCGSPKTQNTAQRPAANNAPAANETPAENEVPAETYDTVESGSSMWANGRLGSMGMTVLDIDNDGTEELMLLDPGPSSGEFKLMITAVQNDSNYAVKYQTVYKSAICKVDFVERNGKTMLEYRRYMAEKDFEGSHYEDPTFFDTPHYFDIALENDNIMLTENGEPFSKIAVVPAVKQ